MTAEQAQQLVEQMRAAQAQRTAMMEELDFSRQQEQVDSQAAAVDRRARESMAKTRNCLSEPQSIVGMLEQ